MQEVSQKQQAQDSRVVYVGLISECCALTRGPVDFGCCVSLMSHDPVSLRLLARSVSLSVLGDDFLDLHYADRWPV